MLKHSWCGKKKDWKTWSPPTKARRTLARSFQAKLLTHLEIKDCNNLISEKWPLLCKSVDLGALTGPDLLLPRHLEQHQYHHCESCESWEPCGRWRGQTALKLPKNPEKCSCISYVQWKFPFNVSVIIYPIQSSLGLTVLSPRCLLKTISGKCLIPQLQDLLVLARGKIKQLQEKLGN